ncbi:Protein trachealess [Eumeta japonica]|uniref:Protein trachealess n=1 Tax=Eumeta variegata TaxID=151549 RepID=A0A4C1SSP6_EUMVA|nr:Protein trachealess [Eumeta japonica]
MTLPGSVSPRDSNNSINTGKTATTLTSLNGGYDYADPLKLNTLQPAALEQIYPQRFPLSHKPYSAAAAMHHTSTTDASSGLTYSNLDQPQYLPHIPVFICITRVLQRVVGIRHHHRST